MKSYEVHILVKSELLSEGKIIISRILMTFGWRNIVSDWASICSRENEESLIEFKSKNEAFFGASFLPGLDFLLHGFHSSYSYYL